MQSQRWSQETRWTRRARRAHEGRRRARPRAGLVSALLFCGMWALTGCATMGHEFPVAPVDDIVIGRTTQTDVQRMFGNPWRVGVEDGDTTWTYGHYKYRLFGRSRTRDLVVRFDANGVVSSYSFNTTEHEDRPSAQNMP